MRHLLRMRWVVAVVLLSFGVVSPASAANGEPAATVINDSSCRDFTLNGDPGVICSERTGVEKRFTTPSGNFVFVANTNTSFTFTGSGGCTWSVDFTKREQWAGGGAHVMQNRYSFDTCSGMVECTETLHFLFTPGEGNGLYRREFECVPVSQP